MMFVLGIIVTLVLGIGVMLTLIYLKLSELVSLASKYDSGHYRELIERQKVSRPSRTQEESAIHSIRSDRGKVTTKSNGIKHTEDQLVNISEAPIDHVFNSIDDYGRIK